VLEGLVAEVVRAQWRPCEPARRLVGGAGREVEGELRLPLGDRAIQGDGNPCGCRVRPLPPECNGLPGLASEYGLDQPCRRVVEDPFPIPHDPRETVALAER